MLMNNPSLQEPENEAKCYLNCTSAKAIHFFVITSYTSARNCESSLYVFGINGVAIAIPMLRTLPKKNFDKNHGREN